MADDEFDNFLERVSEIENLLQMMRSSDSEVSERAGRKADLLLRKTSENRQDAQLRGKEDVEPNRTLSYRTDRTVINYKAFEQMGKANDPSAMSKETFMAQVEKDAKSRAHDRKNRKQQSDVFKNKGNEAFREKKFEKALDFYSKAIDEIRDSALLYENRALTLLHLELFQRVVEDCDRALRLNENSLKALLYKAKALYFLKQENNSENSLSEAFMKHPQHYNLIQDYKEMWMNEVKKKTEGPKL